MGILDFPGPLFEWVDTLLRPGLSPIARLSVWALAAAAASMGIYRLSSSQEKIKAVQDKVNGAQQALVRYEGEFAGLLVLIRSCLVLPLQQVGLVLGPALLGSLPAVCLILWISTVYGHDFPQAAQEIEVRLSPPTRNVSWTAGTRAGADVGVWRLAWPAAGKIVDLRDEAGRSLLSLPLEFPVAVIEKRRWWNTLTGNPVGYLPADAEIDSVSLALPEQEVLGFGPAWLRSWETPFFALLVVFSVAIKILFRIR